MDEKEKNYEESFCKEGEESEKLQRRILLLCDT
jgi:hypothetical protein